MNRQVSDQELSEVLQQVNLQDVLTRVGGFDQEVPWENILSLGEQQRLAFARVLITRPSFTILDEATSALDFKNEGNLYQQLQKTNTTFISVGHRESLFNYHQWVLELSEDSHWQLLTVQDYRRQKAEEISSVPGDNSQARVENSPHQQAAMKPQINSSEELLLESPTTTILTEEGLSHAQMTKLSNYSVSSIRNLASRGKSITGNDGLTYHYDKDPKILKWLRI
ncbi:ATP-binding cassette domain-containing protein [Planktothrix agardhii]|uniref:ATP-binding cassette domain-containing protein n=1 Tax=Planktothrix agardhii TaxID=1160 RepID=UPI0020B42D1A|nr:ATP-binding cassette domain-containing protein [Planktothrix agardhii]CAD5923930.1 putative ABC transporter ATP-binding protein sll0182 [Planktothrix agardhii]